MQWQDIVFSVGGLLLSIFLIPTIKGKQKPEITTSLTYAVILFLFAISYYSLGLKLSAITAIASVICWSILAYQRYRQKQK